MTDEKTLSVVGNKDLSTDATSTSFGDLLPLTKYEVQITGDEKGTRTRIAKVFTTKGNKEKYINNLVAAGTLSGNPDFFRFQ